MNNIKIIRIALSLSLVLGITLTMGCQNKVTQSPGSSEESTGISSSGSSAQASSDENSITSSSDAGTSDTSSEAESSLTSSSGASSSIASSSASSSRSSSSSSISETEVERVNTYLNPALPKAKYQAKNVYVVGVPGFDESVTLASLQGLLANKGTEQIYINANSTYGLWLDVMKSSYGVTAVEGFTTWQLVEKFKDKISGYILCESTMGEFPGHTGTFNINRSVNVATTLANQLNAIVVTDDNKAKADAMGLTQVLDVSGMTEIDLLAMTNYMSKLNKDMAVEQKPIFGANLRDYAVMSNSLMFFSLNAEKKRIDFLNTLNQGAAMFGWGDPEKGEIGFVSEVAKVLSGYTIPSDHSYNLSTLSGFKQETLKQKTKITAVKENKHTVCFMLTDGDNIQFYLGGFNDRKWFGNANRGTFKMGWGIPPTLIDLAAPTAKWYLNNMSEKDGFIIHVGGLGYTYPSLQSKAQLKIQTAQLNDYMRRIDTNIVEIVGNRTFNDTATWDLYTEQPDIDALFYIDYNNYALYRGKIYWSNGKPVISSRLNLWKLDTGTYLEPGGSVEGVTSFLNAASTDPTSADSYSIVNVHCWSMGMNDVKNVVAGLDSSVRVVTPQELAKLVAENVIRD